MTAVSGKRARRLVGLLLAFGIATVSAGAAFVATLWGWGLKCDDSCSTPPPWRNDVDAWQWSALGWVGIGAFACAVLSLIALAVRRRGVAAVICTAWMILATAFLLLFEGSGLTSNVHRGWIGLVPIAAAFVAAIALTPTREDQAAVSRS